MSQHKLLQSNRPKQLMTKALIFKNNLVKKISFDQQTSPLDTSAKLHLRQSHQQNAPEKTQHRLKLKDYIKLNQLSRSKHHSKSKSKQSRFNSSTSLMTNNNFRQTFGPSGGINLNICEKTTQKKKSVNNQQQTIQYIQVVQQQLVKTTEKAMDKLKNLYNIIQATRTQNKNYQDLVFLCKVQGLVQQKLINGIMQINKMFIQHIKAKKEEASICLNVKSLLKLTDQNEPLPISPIKLRRNMSIKQSDNEKTIKKV